MTGDAHHVGIVGSLPPLPLVVGFSSASHHLCKAFLEPPPPPSLPLPSPVSFLLCSGPVTMLYLCGQFVLVSSLFLGGELLECFFMVYVVP